MTLTRQGDIKLSGTTLSWFSYLTSKESILQYHLMGSHAGKAAMSHPWALILPQCHDHFTPEC